MWRVARFGQSRRNSAAGVPDSSPGLAANFPSLPLWVTANMSSWTPVGDPGSQQRLRPRVINRGHLNLRRNYIVMSWLRAWVPDVGERDGGIVEIHIPARAVDSSYD